MLVDSHCHLCMIEGDLDTIISNAKEAGVHYLLNVCTKLDDFQNIKLTSQKYSNVFGSVGIHPNHSNENSITCEQLCKFVQQNNKIIGFGETGLDYYYSYSPITEQKKIFIEHIKAAQSEKLPIIIHCRDSDLDMIEILSSEMRNKPFSGVIHCFTGSKQLAYTALDLGLYISVSGIITFPKALELQNIITTLPINRLLVETDSPYLAPNLRGKQNEPSFVRFIAKKIAQLKKIDFSVVEKVTSNNFCDLFKLSHFL